MLSYSLLNNPEKSDIIHHSITSMTKLLPLGKYQGSSMNNMPVAGNYSGLSHKRRNKSRKQVDPKYDDLRRSLDDLVASRNAIKSNRPRVEKLSLKVRNAASYDRRVRFSRADRCYDFPLSNRVLIHLIFNTHSYTWLK